MSLPFDPEGFPVVNVLHGGGTTGALTADAGNTTTTALSGSGGATPAFIGTSLDMSSIPALLINGCYVMAAALDPKAQVLSVVWSDALYTGVAPNDKYKWREKFGIPEGLPPGGVGSEGGFSLLLNRKAKFATIVFANASTDAMSTTRIATYALASPVEEYDSTKTGALCAPLTAGIAIGVDTVVNCGNTLPGTRYLLQVIGGEGICVRTDGRDPTTGGVALYSGNSYQFTATHASNAVRAIKRTAGTANATVVLTALDLQA